MHDQRPKNVCELDTLSKDEPVSDLCDRINVVPVSARS